MSKKQITIPVFVPHMGCPHRCAFCNQNETSGRYTVLSNDDIAAMIDAYHKSAPASVSRFELAFFGGSFTGIEENLQRRLLGAAMAALDSGSISAIRLSTRPDCINTHTLDLLREYSVETIELGCQSFFDDVLERSKRGHTAKDTFDAIALIKQYGFKFVIQLLPGLPLDTPDKSIESARIAASLQPDAVRLYPAVVLDNTELAGEYRRGEFTPMNLEDAVELLASMIEVFQQNNIPVIRTGLHPLDAHEERSILAGPYHHALGFLARSRIKRRLLEKLLISAEVTGKRITLIIPYKGKEEYIGVKKDTISYLENKFGCAILYIISTEIYVPELML